MCTAAHCKASFETLQKGPKNSQQDEEPSEPTIHHVLEENVGSSSQVVLNRKNINPSIGLYVYYIMYIYMTCKRVYIYIYIPYCNCIHTVIISQFFMNLEDFSCTSERRPGVDVLHVSPSQRHHGTIGSSVLLLIRPCLLAPSVLESMQKP